MQCPNCHQEMNSYTEYGSNGITKVTVCTCGYISRKILCDVIENNPLDIQVNTYSSMGVGAAKKNKKTKHKNKRGIHEKSKRIIVFTMVVLGVFLILLVLCTPKETQYCLTCVKEDVVEVTPTPTPIPTMAVVDDKIDINSLIENISKDDLSEEYQTIIDDIVDSMIEENKHKWEIKEEIKFTRHPNAPKNTRKSYMSYKAITLKTSRQYKMQQIAYTGTHGIRQVNGRYCIALGSAYTKTIGTHVDIILENGEVIPCILADQKQDRHTDSTNRVCFDGSLVEFVVDTDYIINKVRITGDVSNACKEWKTQVEEVIVYEKVEEF